MAEVDSGAALRKMIEAEKAKGNDANKAVIKVWERVVKHMQPTKVEAMAL